ncbi:hypothetical protein C1646_773589, partial [Rhizophagus diaphanus]
MTSIRNYYNFVLVEKDKRDLVKAQRNYLIKIYGTTMEDISILDGMADRIRKRWIKLQQKPKPLDQIDQFKERCIETEIQVYQLSLGRISKNSNYENSENGSPTELEDEESSYEDL